MLANFKLALSSLNSILSLARTVKFAKFVFDELNIYILKYLRFSFWRAQRSLCKICSSPEDSGRVYFAQALFGYFLVLSKSNILNKNRTSTFFRLFGAFKKANYKEQRPRPWTLE
jgi:hypothetical protein